MGRYFLGIVASNGQRSDEQLAHFDRNIAQARAHVVHQRQIVLYLDLLLADQPREEAATLLERLEESLLAFERQRQLILDRFKKSTGDLR